jgi:hypothetical protein
MEQTAVQSNRDAQRFGLGVALLLGGLLGHVLAARAIGGTVLAYRDHLGGFLFLTLVTGALIAAVGTRLWPGRRSVTWLWLGVVQAALGVFVYVTRYSVHG